MSDKEIQQQMDAMRALDEPMPQVGIFWYDPNDHTFFGVCTMPELVKGIPSLSTIIKNNE